MPILPAICQSCGNVYPSGYTVDNSIGVTMADNQPRPCPRCGHGGRIPNGVFNFIGDTAEVISSSDITTEGIQGLIDLLRRLATDPSVTPEQVTDAVAEKTPGLSQVLKKYLVPQSAADFYGLLTMLIALLTLVIMLAQEHHSPSQTSEIVNQVINNCVSNPPLSPLGPRP